MKCDDCARADEVRVGPWRASGSAVVAVLFAAVWAGTMLVLGPVLHQTRHPWARPAEVLAGAVLLLSLLYQILRARRHARHSGQAQWSYWSRVSAQLALTMALWAGALWLLVRILDRPS